MLGLKPNRILGSDDNITEPVKSQINEIELPSTEIEEIPREKEEIIGENEQDIFPELGEDEGEINPCKKHNSLFYPKKNEQIMPGAESKKSIYKYAPYIGMGLILLKNLF